MMPKTPTEVFTCSQNLPDIVHSFLEELEVVHYTRTNVTYIHTTKEEMQPHCPSLSQAELRAAPGFGNPGLPGLSGFDVKPEAWIL